MRLTSVTILGVFDRHDIALDLTRVPLIIVGPNGSGKSTALAVLHSLLTGQWSRLTTLPYQALQITLDGESHFLQRDEFAEFIRLRSLFYLPPNRPLPASWDDLQKHARRRHQISESISALAERYPLYAKLGNFAEIALSGSVLYYPTYRRIERDLNELFEVDDEFGDFSFDFDEPIRNRFQKFGEVIGFGGQDIRHLIERSVSTVEQTARKALNEHSIRFLSALNTPEDIDSREFRSAVMDSSRVDSLITKIRAFANESIDADALRQNLDDLRKKLIVGKQGRLKVKEDILIYYVAELMNVLERIDSQARPIHQFCDIISAYLRPSKMAILDEADFAVHIRSISGDDVDLDSLSSGEKQILSLFAFLIFSPAPRGSILIIDEPELSLSVAWQKRLLQDLVATGRPVSIVAATHSPFIFERFPLDEVISLGEI